MAAFLVSPLLTSVIGRGRLVGFQNVGPEETACSRGRYGIYKRTSEVCEV